MTLNPKESGGARLVVEAATVSYPGDAGGGDHRVLKEVSVIAEPGEIVAVLGASGSGKSTLLRAIAGLVPLSEGRIELDGRDLEGVPTHRRDLGLMFQDHALFGHMSVAENIGYGLKIAGTSRSERERRVAELLKMVGLEALAPRRPDQLSGGEAQRVALARALAPRPRLLMLDEPLGSLDRALRETLTDDLSTLLGSLHQTSLHVTHDQAEAFAVADRLVVLDNGEIVANGDPAVLWADPQTTFLATFFGRPNIWPATIFGSGALARLGQASELGSILVPLTAISILAESEAQRPLGPGRALVRVVVSTSRFDQGLYRTTGELVGNDGEPGPALRATFLADQPIPIGSSVALGIDLAGVVALT